MREVRLIIIIAISIVSFKSGAQDQWKNVYSESAWKERDVWQRAEEIIAKMGAKPGDKVADIGCHEGYMTMKLAKVVGSNGQVFAVDVAQNKLDKLSNHLKDRLIRNVTTVKGDYDNPKLAVNTLKSAIIIDTYHEMDDHDKMLIHIKNALVPGGRLVICEPIANERKKLARTEQESRHELGMNYAMEDLRKAGFNIIFKQDPYIDRQKIKGDNMWIIVAEKQR